MGGDITYNRIGIVGAGNTGLALAAHLLSKGFTPFMFTRRAHVVEMLGEGLHVSGVLKGVLRIHATTDMQELVNSCDLLIVSTWANAHSEVFRSIASSVSTQRCPAILVLNGNWGAYQAALIVKQYGKYGNIAESAGMPYVSRYEQLSDYLKVTICGIKKTITIAQQNADDPELDEFLASMFDEVDHERSVLATSLSAPNPVIHAPLCLLNMARIQGQEHFHILVDGFSEETERMVLQLDGEREAIAKHLHVAYMPILAQLNGFWNVHHPTLRAFFRSESLYTQLEGPTSIYHRFIQEDVPYGIAPLIDLGKAIDVPTPVSAALLELYRSYLQPYERLVFDAASIENSSGIW